MAVCWTNPWVPLNKTSLCSSRLHRLAPGFLFLVLYNHGDNRNDNNGNHGNNNNLAHMYSSFVFINQA